MVGVTSAPQAGKKKSTGPSIQLTDEDKKTFEKKEHQLIYRAFLDTLENPEKQTRQEMEEIAKKLQEKLPKEQEQKLQDELQPLGKQLTRLQNENEKKIFTFVLENRGKIFNDVNQKIKSLSEENFLQFLISVFEKIREKNLASKENLENNKIKEVINECVDDIRGKEAKDSLIKLAGWPFGIKVDPKKTFLALLMSELKEKVPFLGGGKEKGEPPLSDEEMVTTFLRKSLLPVALFAFTTLIFGTGPIMLSIAVVGLLVTEVNAVKSLFSNNRKGTLYNPDTEKEKEWGGEISSRISEILETPVKGAGKDNQPALAEEQLTQKGKLPTVPGQGVNGAEKQSFQEQEDERRKEAENQAISVQRNGKMR
ncbi:MAG: hypothetical protein LBC06_01970 [Rickettsiales bacterium]|jgi:hypothetical protein|nr:hypothetical protein [Rickettsiales bacterium]